MSEPLWLVLARQQIGVTEKPGPASNAIVLDYFRDAGHPEIKDDAVAWCAAFLGAMLRRAGVQPTGSLAAVSYEKWGVKLDKPMLGAIGVKRRPGDKWMRHVGIIVAADATNVWMVSGNARDRVGIDAFKRADFTAYRWPEGVPFPTAPLPSAAPGSSGANEA